MAEGHRGYCLWSPLGVRRSYIHRVQLLHDDLEVWYEWRNVRDHVAIAYFCNHSGKFVGSKHNCILVRLDPWC